MTGIGHGAAHTQDNQGPAYAHGDQSPDSAAVHYRLAQQLPFLRRYARALTGQQESGDAFVRAMLEAALTSPELLARIGRGRVQLYEAFSGIWNTAHVEPQGHPLLNRDEDGAGLGFQDRLAEVSPIQRQALLLTQLEEFSMAEAGEILGLSPGETAFLVEQAVAEIEQDVATDVLII